jgi:hypothetical protein
MQKNQFLEVFPTGDPLRPNQPGKRLYSQITDWAATEQADLAAVATTLNGIATGVAALDAQIVAFQASPGTISATDQAALDSIVTASAALNTQAQAIVVTPPAAPAAPSAA